MHMGTCEKGSLGARPHKAILYKIVDRGAHSASMRGVFLRQSPSPGRWFLTLAAGARCPMTMGTLSRRVGPYSQQCACPCGSGSRWGDGGAFRGGAPAAVRVASHLVECHGCACCVCFPGLRHPVAVVAWYLFVCRSSGRRCASRACLAAPLWFAAARPVRSLPVRRLAFPSPWCLLLPGALRPCFSWAPARGTWRVA